MQQSRFRNTAKRSADSVAKAGLWVILSPFIGIYYCIKYTQKGTRRVSRAKWERQVRNRAKNRRLPKSEPLAEGRSSKPLASTTNTPASFLGLPVEIRLEIYRLALGDPEIVQVGNYHSSWGPRPEHWHPNQPIRSDDDPSSLVLRRTIGLGGSGLQQFVAPPRRGCVIQGVIMQLICGDEKFSPGYCNFRLGSVSHMDLMRTCRVMYGEMLDVLYAHNTVSLFGWEMAWYFCRNASPEGLQRVRFVHFALMISSFQWDAKPQKKNIQDTIRMLRDSLPSLRQLDVEVVLLWNQPKDAERFWMWLKNDVLGQFRGLDQFVLKVVVYKPLPDVIHYNYEDWTPECEDLENWVEGEYHDLKRRLTSKEAARS